MKFGEKVCQTKLLSRLSHKVCRLLSSAVLLRKITNNTPKSAVAHVPSIKPPGVVIEIKVNEPNS